MNKEYPAGIKVAHEDASALVLTGPGKFWGMIMHATTANAVAVLYDNIEGSGAEICELTDANDKATASFSLAKPVDVTIGLYISLTNCEGIVYYETRV